MPGGNIPIISLVGPPAQVGASIDSACREHGFFAVIDNGVSDAVIEEAWTLTTDFFDQPLETKLAARHCDPKHPYGYFPAGGEALAASRGEVTPPDIKESFNLAPPPEHQDGTGRFGGVARIWPTAPPGLAEAWTAYYDALFALSERLLGLFAVGLSVEPELFLSRTTQHLSALRGLNYPALSERPAPNQLRAGAHSDYGTLTVLLPGPGIGGLEVQTLDGQWMPVQPIDNTFVVNVGDMMQRWTNDQWRSPLHRIVVPPNAGERRQSMAFFHQPNWDAEIATIETCVDQNNPRQYEPVLAGPWLEAKFDAASAG